MVTATAVERPEANLNGQFYTASPRSESDSDTIAPVGPGHRHLGSSWQRDAADGTAADAIRVARLPSRLHPSESISE